MKTILVVVGTALLSLVASSAAAGDLLIEGIALTYGDVAEVQITLRNVGRQAINLDSFQPDALVVERQLDGSDIWELGYGWRCANAGVGTPRSIESGATLELPLLRSGAFRPKDKVEWFETEEGGRRPIKGHYRVSVHYSTETWSDITHVPKAIETVTSSTFEIP